MPDGCSSVHVLEAEYDSSPAFLVVLSLHNLSQFQKKIMNSPFKSPKKTAYFSRSLSSSNTTNSLLPVELNAVTTPRMPNSRSEKNHRIVVVYVKLEA
jgi:hypothetical protein